MKRDTTENLSFYSKHTVFTKNIDIAVEVYREKDGSAFMLNDHRALRVDWMPFAGLQESGYGTGDIPQTINDMQVEKMLVIHKLEL